MAANLYSFFSVLPQNYIINDRSPIFVTFTLNSLNFVDHTSAILICVFAQMAKAQVVILYSPVNPSESSLVSPSLHRDCAQGLVNDDPAKTLSGLA